MMCSGARFLRVDVAIRHERVLRDGIGERLSAKFKRDSSSFDRGFSAVSITDFQPC